MNEFEIIKMLDLQLHPEEGGYFKRTYESISTQVNGKEYPLATSIYYLLTIDQPIGFLHRNKSDILHFYHAGAPMVYTLVSEDQTIETKVLGPDISQGHLPQLFVKGGIWKTSTFDQALSSFSLISEVVVPGFCFEDNELATDSLFSKKFVAIYDQIVRWIKK